MSCGQASSGKLLRKNTEVEAQFIFHHERGCFVRKHLTVVHFSPTGGTRRAALLLAEGLAERIDELDLTLPAPTGRAFGPQDAVLFAGPVFGGRLPVLMTQRLKNCTGEGTPAVPAVSETCTACGQCAAQCPARAISPDDPKHTDPERCFLCMRCIARCPQHARTYPAKAQAMVDQRLAPLRTVRRENELFV